MNTPTTEATLPGTMVAATTPVSVTDSSSYSVTITHCELRLYCSSSITSSVPCTTFMLAAPDSNSNKNTVIIILVIIIPIILCAVVLLAIFLMIVVPMSIKSCGKCDKKVPPTGGQDHVSHPSSEAVLRKETLNNMEFLMAQLYPVEDNFHKEPQYETISEGKDQPRNLFNQEHLLELDYIHNDIVLTNENLNSAFKDV